MVDAQGRDIAARWVEDHDNPVVISIAVGDGGVGVGMASDCTLSNLYEYIPLVGLTKTTDPSGRSRSYSYKAGRLVSERNTSGDLMASYGYRLWGDGSAVGSSRMNLFSVSRYDYDDSGAKRSSIEASLYDGFGMPVCVTATAAGGGGLIRVVTDYDALDRPVRQYLPVETASIDEYATDPLGDAMAQYGDSRPFVQTCFRGLRSEDVTEILSAGEKMLGHPTKNQYVCNNTTDPMLMCRKYLLGASALVEAVTLAGFYARGQLDVVRQVVQYDLNGNATRIVRSACATSINPGVVASMDDVSMSYCGNRLVKAVDQGEEMLFERVMDFPGGVSEYGYDSDGRMISDSGRDIEQITYSPGGHPLGIYFTDGSCLLYTYSADGQRLQERYGTSPDIIGGIPRYFYSDRYYIGCFELETQTNALLKTTKPILDRINLPWGYADAQGSFFTYVNDYQGNVRAVVNSKGEAVQTNDYYPDGTLISTSTGQQLNRRKFGGKELETRSALNAYDQQARQYFAPSLRFDNPDPLAGNRPWESPYLFCGNNPVNKIDPTGLTDFFVSGTDQHKYVDDGVDQVIELDQDNYAMLFGLSHTDPEYASIVASGIIRDDLFSTIKNVLEGVPFVAYNSQPHNNCFKYASEQNRPSDIGDAINATNFDATIPAEYANNQLLQGNSIVAGVNEGVSLPTVGNRNPKTHHFINLVGQGFEMKNGIPTNYFEYYDNGTQHSSRGTNTLENRLYQEGKSFIDRTNIIVRASLNRTAIKTIYRLTEVRKNK